MKAGVIGNAGYAAKVIDLLRKKKINLKYIYHPNKKKNYNTNKLSDLLSCDLIFILSPIQTHHKYLKYFFKNFSGYIFCEKPIATEIKQLNNLKISSKLFINLNYNFSDLSKNINSSIINYKLKKIISCNFFWTHGFAFKNSAQNNWRFKKKKYMTINLAVHFIDLFANLFNVKIRSNQISLKTSSIKIKNDNNFIFIDSNPKFFGFFSYSTSVTNKIIFYFENGLIEYDGKFLSTYFPRDNFDKIGNFKEAKLVKRIKLNSPQQWSQSLNRSIDYFLMCAKYKKKINKKFNSNFFNLNKSLVSF